MEKGGKGSKAAADNRANQMNPNNPAYAESRAYTKAVADNRSNQLNPNSEAYAKSREGKAPENLNNYPGAWIEREPLPVPKWESVTGKCAGCGAEVMIARPSGSYRCEKCGSVEDNDWGYDDNY